ncbi:MAG: hypothetical protein C1O27_002028 [Chloroflexi bacterium]|nr:MAG: hypothetical protein C1O27_002028 [Chloroflexota bacterium]
MIERLGSWIFSHLERGNELDFGLSDNIEYNSRHVSPPKAELRYWRGILAS